jgi:hypothetical protein
MVLETLIYLEKREAAFGLIKRISEELSGQRWLSTQTTAFSLLAVGKFVAKDTRDAFTTNFGYSVNNGPVKNILSKNPMAQQTIDLKAGEKKKIKVINNSGQPLFSRIILEGKPVTGDSTNAAMNLNLDVVYKLLDGTVVDPAEIEQGTDFMAEVTILNPGTRTYRYEQMELNQIFPSGWEIINTRISGDGKFVESSVPDYQDIRDDRAYTYFSLDSKQSKTFRILLNASYLGKFYLPTLTSQAMYDVTINAHKRGRWVKVVKPGE